MAHALRRRLHTPLHSLAHFIRSRSRGLHVQYHAFFSFIFYFCFCNVSFLLCLNPDALRPCMQHAAHTLMCRYRADMEASRVQAVAKQSKPKASQQVLKLTPAEVLTFPGPPNTMMAMMHIQIQCNFPVNQMKMIRSDSSSLCFVCFWDLIQKYTTFITFLHVMIQMLLQSMLTRFLGV